MGKDMRGQDLTQYDFNQADLRDVNLEGANLVKISVCGISFEGANLTAADISNANIIESDFTNAVLTNANLSGTSFTFCNLTSVQLQNATLTKVSIHEGTVNDTDLENALLDRCIITSSLNRVNLNGASMQSAHLTLEANTLQLQLTQLNEAFISNSTFTDIDGQGAELERVTISNGNLERCDLTNANLQRIIVGETTFTNCNFTNGNLHDAVVTNSHFIQCDFTECDLTNVNLQDCTLDECVFTGAKYNSRTYWPAGFDIEGQSAIKEMTDMEKNIAAIQTHMDSPNLSEDTSQKLREQYESTGVISAPNDTRSSSYKDSTTNTWDNKEHIFGSTKSANRPDYDQTNVIEQLIQENQKIQAIKLWRECTGNSLKEAKDIIEYFEQHGVWMTVDDLPRQVPKPSDSQPLQNLSTTSQPSPSLSLNSTSTTKELCASLVNEGKKVQAIKLWRERTGASLKEAKMQLEQFERDGTWSAITAISDSKESYTPEPYDSIDAEDGLASCSPLVWLSQLL